LTWKALNCLGLGGFAEIRFCTCDVDGAPFAKKVLTANDEESTQRFHREVEILQRIPGPNIMPNC